MVGFSSLGSFSARFSDLVGASPTAYRAESVKAGGPPPIPGCFVFMWTRPTVRNSREAPRLGPD
jgi:AraC-like DNA-binding protein